MRFVRLRAPGSTTAWITVMVAVSATLLAMAVLAFTTGEAYAAGEIHVRPAATGSGDGIDWDNAATLHDALENIAEPGDEIWVASGVYTPGLSANDTFLLPDNVEIYGGFVATETVRSQRDWGSSPTVLSGDIEGDDVAADEVASWFGIVRSADDIVGSNSNHVVTIDGTTGTALGDFPTLDGFIIAGGQANGGALVNSPDRYGGGLTCRGNESGNFCAPTLRNLVFSGNLAETGGGAFYASGYYSGNIAANLMNIAFVGNFADYGGAVLLDSPDGGSDGTEIVNSTFYENQASTAGAGIYINGSPGNALPTLVNVILWENTLVSEGVKGADEEIYSLHGDIDILNSIIHGGIGGPAIVLDSEGGSVNDGGGNLSGDPMFVYPSARDLRPSTGSPAIDSGYDISSVDRDLSGWQRKIDGDGDGTAAVDIGAYETERHYLLTVSNPDSALFEVTSNTPDIHCGSTCIQPIPEGYVITLTATLTGTGSTFSGWTGDCSGTDACVLTMNGPRNVALTSTVNQYTLTTDIVGSGSVAKTPDQASYTHGTEVALTATPEGGWSFAGWSGDATGSDSTVNVSMTGNRTVVATFVDGSTGGAEGPELYLPALQAAAADQ